MSVSALQPTVVVTARAPAKGWAMSSRKLWNTLLIQHKAWTLFLRKWEKPRETSERVYEDCIHKAICHTSDYWCHTKPLALHLWCYCLWPPRWREIYDPLDLWRPRAGLSDPKDVWFRINSVTATAVGTNAISFLYTINDSIYHHNHDSIIHFQNLLTYFLIFFLSGLKTYFNFNWDIIEV